MSPANSKKSFHGECNATLKYTNYQIIYYALSVSYSGDGVDNFEPVTSNSIGVSNAAQYNREYRLGHPKNYT